MDSDFYNKTIEHKSSLKKGLHTETIIKNCRFSESDWRGLRFQSCLFLNCSLEFINMDGTGLMDAQFRECKLTGIDFNKCQSILFDISFDKCRLLSCNFSGLPMTGSVWKHSRFEECFFNESILKKSEFSESSFYKSEFFHCDLSGSDFSEARDYLINPTHNTIKKAKFSYPHVLGLLEAFEINVTD